MNTSLEEFLFSDLQSYLLAFTGIQQQNFVDVVVVVPPPAPGVGKSFHESEEGSIDQGVCQNEVTFPWPILNCKGNWIFLDTTFQIDNWAPVYFLTDVPMFTDEQLSF